MAKLKLRFDLIDLLHRVEDDRRKRIAYTPILREDAVKREFGRRAIDKILERTNDGIDKKDNPFKKYSKAYIKSLAFQVYGKSAGQVNLKLSGEMQADIDVIKTDRTGVTIGFRDGDQNDKAYGHVYGKGSLPVRDFWGLPDDDQEAIMKTVLRDANENGLIANLIFLEEALKNVPGIESIVGLQDQILFEEDF